MSIADNLASIRTSIPAGVTLVAVSKTKPVSAIREAYAAGQRVFGENRVQELQEKAPELPADVQWHFIGHLQTKKVKQLVAHTALIHSVDTEKLLEEINKRAGSIDRIADCLLQVHIAEESTKYGFAPDEIRTLVQSGSLGDLPNIRVRGLMGMATFTIDEVQIGREFGVLNGLYQELADSQQWNTLSMGMSGDYQLAIEHGSNMVRIGSAIFGSRN